jgi:hypothetical protein
MTLGRATALLGSAALLAALLGAVAPLAPSIEGTIGAAAGSLINGPGPAESGSAARATSTPSATSSAANPPSAASSTSAAPTYAPADDEAAAFLCSVVNMSDGTLQALVLGPAGWSGYILVYFSDGTADRFAPTTEWFTDSEARFPVPAQDIGASARPAYCSAAEES